MKAHEADVKEIAYNKEKVNFGGPLALVSKTNFNEASSEVEYDGNEEGLIVNFVDEAIGFYFNNNVKKH